MAIAKSIFAYREECIKQYNRDESRATDAYNVKAFLNSYKQSIMVFDLHGGKAKCKEHLKFINLCWEYLNSKYPNNKED